MLRFLERRGVITLVAAPGEGDVNVVVCDDAVGHEDPPLARLLGVATSGAPPAGPPRKRAPMRIAHDPLARPVSNGKLCGQRKGGF
jgi:hypothetical protein